MCRRSHACKTYPYMITDRHKHRYVLFRLKQQLNKVEKQLKKLKSAVYHLKCIKKQPFLTRLTRSLPAVTSAFVCWNAILYQSKKNNSSWCRQHILLRMMQWHDDRTNKFNRNICGRTLGASLCLDICKWWVISSISGAELYSNDDDNYNKCEILLLDFSFSSLSSLTLACE